MSLEDESAKIRDERSFAQRQQRELEDFVHKAHQRLRAHIAEFIEAAKCAGLEPAPARITQRPRGGKGGKWDTPAIHKEVINFPASWAFPRNLRLTIDGEIMRRTTETRLERTGTTWLTGNKIRVRYIGWSTYDFLEQIRWRPYMGEIIELGRDFGVVNYLTESNYGPPGTLVFIEPNWTHIFDGTVTRRLAELLNS